MHCWVPLLVVVFAGLALGSNVTSPTPSLRHGKKCVRANQCCVVPTGLMPPTMKAAFKTCFKKYPMAKPPKQPVGKPPNASAPPPTTQEVKNARACVAECVFSQEGLLTPDKEVNRTAVIAYFASSQTDKDLSNVRSTAVDKCLGSYKQGIDSSLECKSGAGDLHKCINREIFLNCPKKMWSALPECVDLKERVTKDKDMPVFFRSPKRGSKEAPKRG